MGKIIQNRNYNYIHKKDHRNKSPLKSQWTISETSELNCFITAKSKNWIISNNGWGLHLINNKIEYLGRRAAQKGIDQLFFAKFLGASNKNWHGFPADHLDNNDRPELNILDSWVKEGYLTQAKRRKIEQCKPCRL